MQQEHLSQDAQAAGLTMTVLVAVGVHNGYGLHLTDIKNDAQREVALKYTYIAPAVSVVASTAGKISMVFFLIRLLGTSAQSVHHWFLLTITGIMVALNLFVIGILLGHCRPMEKSWKPLIPGSCIHNNVLDYGGRIQAIWNALTDFVVAGFPVYMVWRLQMRNTTKWGLSFLMGGGVFAGAATLVKVYYMRDLTKLSDVTYAWGPIAIWYM
jgi:hypothetical protein